MNRVLAILAVAALLVVGVAFAKEPPVVAQGVHTSFGLAEYPLGGQPRPFPCGGTFTTQTWPIAKLYAYADVAGVANVEVRTFYGDEVVVPPKTHQPKRDRFQVIDAPLTSIPKRVGDFDWFVPPDDVGEPYVWQFDVLVNGQLQSSCEITLTRV